MPSDRNAALAAELERIAAELREGEATLCGYRVRRSPAELERGAVAYGGGWFEFRIEHPDGWFGFED